MNSESESAAAGAAVFASTEVDCGVAARGPRAAHPASSVTASAAEVTFTRVCTVLVFLAETLVAASDVENEEHAEDHEQYEGCVVHFSNLLWLTIYRRRRTPERN
jgi:hypothetical protein